MLHSTTTTATATLKLLLILHLLTLTTAHLAISDPKPLNYDALNGSLHYNTPLHADGSDFPCKGFHKDPGLGEPVKVWRAGEMASFTIDTTFIASHNGGSCQASLSYTTDDDNDNTPSFKVLKSFIGGCPRGAYNNEIDGSLVQTFEFPIPQSAPGGNALFAWTWFTVTGFREMYMNCAHVLILPATNHPPPTSSSSKNPSSSWPPENAPAMFIGEINNCKSTEWKNLRFPDPGPNVEYGASSFENALPTGEGCSGGGGSSSNSGAPAGNYSSPGPAGDSNNNNNATAVAPPEGRKAGKGRKFSKALKNSTAVGPPGGGWKRPDIVEDDDGDDGRGSSRSTTGSGSAKFYHAEGSSGGWHPGSLVVVEGK